MAAISLIKQLEGYASIALVGSCKNAGKTTVLGYLIRSLPAASRPLGITSIGRDGEGTDLVTGTPKPRIFVPAGTVLATAKGLLCECDITQKVVATTGISSPLGEVVVLEALSDGYVQLAGPSIASQLTQIKTLMQKAGAATILIDGAISRKTFVTGQIADAVVLCTGASYNADMGITISHTGFMHDLFMLPKVQNDAVNKQVARFPDSKFVLVAEEAAPMEKAEGLSAIPETTERKYLAISGAITDPMLQPLVRMARSLCDIQIVAEDSSKILLSDEAYEKLRKKGATFAVLQKSNLVAVTVNPFSAYGTHYDREQFYNAMQKRAQVPVFDITDEREGDALCLD